jgi:type II secretory pathway pseudopilin PulG
MNEILLDVLSALVTAVVIPVISIVGAKLVSWLSNQLNDSRLEKINETITAAVRSTFQTYVDVLKKNGTFDAESQKEALSKAKDTILSQLTDGLTKWIKNSYGDVDSWLTTQIEATIDRLKNE